MITFHVPNQHSELLTPGEVASMFGVDPKTVTRWARGGRLRSIRTPGGHRRFYRADVLAIIEGGRGTAQEAGSTNRRLDRQRPW